MIEHLNHADRALLEKQLNRLKQIRDDHRSSADQQSLAARGIHLIQVAQTLMGPKTTDDLTTEVKNLRKQLEQMEKRLQKLEKQTPK